MMAQRIAATKLRQKSGMKLMNASRYRDRNKSAKTRSAYIREYAAGRIEFSRACVQKQRLSVIRRTAVRRTVVGRAFHRPPHEIMEHAIRLQERKALQKVNMPTAVFRRCRHLTLCNSLIAVAIATCVQKQRSAVERRPYRATEHTIQSVGRAFHRPPHEINN